MRILLLSLALVSAGAMAYLGSGNQNRDMVAAYLKIESGSEDITSVEFFRVGIFTGAVAAAADVFDDFTFGYSICYPVESDVGQLKAITAKYIEEHPEETNEQMSYLIWISHAKAFGFDADEDCFEHEAWKAATFDDDGFEEMVY